MIPRIIPLLLIALPLAGCGDIEWFPDPETNQASLGTVTGAERNAPVVSQPFTVTGSSASISISGGEYSIDDGPFTATSGTVQTGQKVTVRHISSTTYGTSKIATLTIANESLPFTSVTMSKPPVFVNSSSVTDFTFAPKLDVEPNTAIVSESRTISGNTSPAPISITDGEYSINGGNYSSAAGTINAGQTLSVRHTSAGTYHTIKSTRLTVGGVRAGFASMTKGAPFANFSTVSPVNSDPTGIISVAQPLSAIKDFTTSTQVSFSIRYQLNNTSNEQKNVGLTIAGADAQNRRIFSGTFDAIVPANASPYTNSHSFGSSALTIAQYNSITKWLVTKIVIYQ